MINQPITQKAGAWQAWILILVNQLPVVAIASLMPALPTIGKHFSNIGNAQILIPLLLAAPGICIALIAPFAGFWVDKFGRRKLLIIFLFLYGLGGVFPFFVDGFNVVLGGRLLLGIGEAFVLVLGNVLLADYFEEKERNKWLMLQGIVGAVMAAMLFGLSGYLANIGWNFPFLVYSIALILGILAIFFIYEPLKSDKLIQSINTPFSAYPWKIIGTIFGAMVVFASVYFVYTLHFSMALVEIGITDKIQLGQITALASIGAPIGAILFKLISSKSFWLKVGLLVLFFGIGYIGISISTDSTSVTAFAFIQQLGTGMTIPIFVSWALQKIPIAFRGVGMGFWSSGFFLGQFINPLLMAPIQNITGGLLPTYRVFGIACLVFVAVLILVSGIKKKNSIA